MSLTGILISVEPDGERTGASWGKPEHRYPVWKLTVDQTGDSAFQRSKPDHISATTGRSDVVDRARQLIGKRVRVLRGGKVGLVGGIEDLSREDQP